MHQRREDALDWIEEEGTQKSGLGLGFRVWGLVLHVCFGSTVLGPGSSDLAI